MPQNFKAMNCFVSLVSQDLVYINTLLDIEFPNLFLIIQNLSTGSLNPTKNSVIKPLLMNNTEPHVFMYW